MKNEIRTIEELLKSRLSATHETVKEKVVEGFDAVIESVEDLIKNVYAKSYFPHLAPMMYMAYSDLDEPITQNSLKLHIIPFLEFGNKEREDRVISEAHQKLFRNNCLLIAVFIVSESSNHSFNKSDMKDEDMKRYEEIVQEGDVNKIKKEMIKHKGIHNPNNIHIVGVSKNHLAFFYMSKIERTQNSDGTNSVRTTPKEEQGEAEYIREIIDVKINEGAKLSPVLQSNSARVCIKALIGFSAHFLALSIRAVGADEEKIGFMKGFAMNARPHNAESIEKDFNKAIKLLAELKASEIAFKGWNQPKGEA